MIFFAVKFITIFLYKIITRIFNKVSLSKIEYFKKYNCVKFLSKEMNRNFCLDI